MRKYMKKAVSFLMAVCLLAGNSYIDTEAETSVTMSEWTEAVEESLPAEQLLPKGLLSYLENKENRVAAAEENTGESYIFYDPTGGSSITIKEGATVSITGTMEFMLTKLDAAGNRIDFVANIDSISSSSPEIASVEKINEGNGYRVRITPNSPGTTVIMAEIATILTGPNGAPLLDANGNPQKGGVQTFTCTVNVEMGIDKSDIHWKNISNNKKVLVLNQFEEYQIRLSGVENEFVNGSLTQWVWPNNGVIVVDETTGTIKPQGAGVATVSMKPATGNQKAEEFTVVISPTGTNIVDANVSEYKNQIKFDTFSDSFTLHTNGNPAANMTWEIYALTYNGSIQSKEELKKDSKLMNCTISELDGILQFTGVKAGTYQVIGYASTDRQYADQAWNRVVFDITVNTTLQNTTKYLSVGDTYSILENCNIPPDRFSELISVEYIDKIDGPFVADMNPNTGLVTALNQGEVQFTVRYRQSPADSIFAPTDQYGNRKLEVTYTFHVIDEISLNTTSLSMYTGTTYQLVANVTDRTAPVVWESSDEKIATVDENGLVTAKKATGNKTIQITASQTIDGVKKYVVCYVFIQAAVTKVTLNPNNVIIKVNEYETIKATVAPSGLIGTSLHWLSSDPSIFTIVESTDLMVTVQGKTGGTAVLTALNAENVVVGYCKITVSQEAQGISLSQTAVTAPLSQQTFQLYAKITPENTTNTKIIWKSQNTGVVTIDQNGLVTFKKAGTATISAQSEDNPKLITYCTFTLLDVVSSLKLDTHELEMYTGETRRLSYVMTPAVVDNPKVNWTSFNTSVVAVDNTGMVTAKGPGTAQIMIMSASNGSFYDICTVVVKQKATSVKMNYTELTMDCEEYFDMEVTIAPANSTEASLIWESLNPAVATVSSTGRITARAAGTAIVSVRTLSGVTSYCTITVLEPVISLELDPTDIIIDVGEIFQIDPIFKPTEPSIKEVIWTSYNEDVATINALGEVEGISRGTTIVTCETIDGGFRAFCLIEVLDPIMEVSISPDNYRLGYGKTVLLTATVTNRGETLENMPLIWESSDEEICTVDEAGKVTGVGYGYATIRAEVDDDYGAYATCEIRVVREVTSIRLNHNVLTIIQGNTASIEATVQPSNATYMDLTLSSEDENVALIDEEGVITALRPGNTWIWAKTKDNSGKYARCYVTVIAPIPATGITVSEKQIVLVAGETKKIVYTTKPANTTDDITWSSSDESIATVDGSGVITAQRTGSTTVTILTSSGKTSQIEVTVIGLSRSKVELPVYTKYSGLTVDGATNKVRWDVEDTSICEVNNNGVITARKAGTTYVTATVNGRTLRCKVTVTKNKKK